MKTLKKLQLNDVKVLSNSEMKNILGGTAGSTATLVTCELNAAKDACVTLGKCKEHWYGDSNCTFTKTETAETYSSSCTCNYF